MALRTSRLLAGLAVTAVAIAGGGALLGMWVLDIGIALSVLFLLAELFSARQGLRRAALGWLVLMVAALVCGVSGLSAGGIVWGGLFGLFGMLLLLTEPALYRTPTPS